MAVIFTPMAATDIDLVHTVSSRLLYVTSASERQVVAGRAFEIPEWRIRLTDPAAP